MIIAQLPADEDRRLRALQELEVLDSASEPIFDALVKAASLVCNTPISLISLVDQDRQWFKANHGLEGVQQTARSVAFCSHAILDANGLEVPDTLNDGRFADNPLVLDGPHIRFYAGFPLLLKDNSCVGTLCVIDREPRTLDATQRAALEQLAKAAAVALEMRLDKRRRITATEALEQSEARLKAIVDNSPLGIFVTDTEGRCTFTNARWQSIYGLSAEESLGDGWIRALTNETRQSVTQAWAQAIEAGQEFDMEFPVNEVHGTPVMVHCRSQPLRNGHDDVTGFVGVVNDITDRVKAQHQQQAQHQLLNSAIEALDAGFVLFDSEHRMIMCNQVYRRMYDLDPVRFPLGCTYKAILHHGASHGVLPAVANQDGHWLRSRLGETPGVRIEAEQQLPDGRILRVVDQRLGARYTVGVRVDITGLVAAREDAKAALLAKNIFLANMSHEVRTPLNAVSGMLSALRLTPLSVVQAKYLDLAEGAMRRQVTLLEDLLDLSRIESRQIDIQLAPVDLDDLLGELADVMSPLAADKRLELVFEVQPGLPDRVVSDGRRLRQVLTALVSNAIKFTDSGEVTVGMSVTALSGTVDGLARLELFIEDTGLGMSPAELDEILLPFSGSGGRARHRAGVTGLRLSLAKGIVEALGGSLRISSRLGLGSRFEIELPVQAADGPMASDLAGACVLLCNPSPGVAKAVAAMADALDWSLTCSASAHAPEAKPGPLPQGVLGYVLCDESCLGPKPTACAVAAWAGPNVARVVLATADGGAGALASDHPAPVRLAKPVTRKRMLAAMSRAREQLAGTLPEPAPESGPLVRVLQGLQILLVEDNVDNQFVAIELLTAAGADITLATDGLDAVHRLSHGTTLPDLVLMDLQLPVMDGLEATRRIRAMPAMQSLPIIAVTANASDFDRQLCLDAGMNDHVGKPFELAHLLSVIRRHTPDQAQPPDADIATSWSPMPGSSGLPLALAESLGVDLAGALERLGGDEELYRELLCRLIAQLRLLPDELRQNITDSRALQASRLLHTLKGNAGTLGARALYESSALAERELAAEPEGAAAVLITERAVAVMLAVTPQLEQLHAAW